MTRSVCAVVAAVLVLGGCTSAQPQGVAAPRSDGPLRIGGDAGTLCLPRVGAATDLTYGMEVLVNKGNTPVRLTGIRLVQGHGLRVQGVYVVPVTGDTLIGNWMQWPPPNSATRARGVQWADRSQLAGTVVPPQAASTHFNLLLRARTVRATKMAGFRAVEVRYTANNTRYAEQSSTQVVLRRPRC